MAVLRFGDFKREPSEVLNSEGTTLVLLGLQLVPKREGYYREP